jgi:hypothetical protein
VSEGKKVRWTIASARQDFPTVVDMAAREPQDIYRRDELVARVVSPDVAPPARQTMAEALAELQRICAEENYSLEVPERRDRPNPFGPSSRAPRKPKKKQR